MTLSELLNSWGITEDLGFRNKLEGAINAWIKDEIVPEEAIGEGWSNHWVNGHNSCRLTMLKRLNKGGEK